MATDVKNDASLSTSLVSYWELEEASGTRYDSHGSNDLTDVNTVGQGTGIQGNCASLAKANSESFSAGDVMDITTDRSFSFWWKPSSLTTPVAFFGKWGSGGYSFEFGWTTSNKISFYHTSTGSNYQWKTGGSFSPSVGNWYHIVGMYDKSAGTFQIYVNGVSAGTITGCLTSIYNGTSPLTIGRVGVTDELLDGDLDEIGVWDKLLSTDEIADLYNSGAGIPYEDAGGGATANNSARRQHFMMM